MILIWPEPPSLSESWATMIPASERWFASCLAINVSAELRKVPSDSLQTPARLWKHGIMRLEQFERGPMLPFTQAENCKIIGEPGPFPAVFARNNPSRWAFDIPRSILAQNDANYPYPPIATNLSRPKKIFSLRIGRIPILGDMLYGKVTS